MIPDPNDYDRKEREDQRVSTRRHISPMRGGRRLLFLDLLLLVLIAGVLVPYLMRREVVDELGPYELRLKRRVVDDSTVLLLRVSLPEDSRDAGGLFLWTIMDSSEETVYEQHEVLPEPGEVRELTAVVDSSYAGLTCRLRTGDLETVLKVPILRVFPSKSF